MARKNSRTQLREDPSTWGQSGRGIGVRSIGRGNEKRKGREIIHTWWRTTVSITKWWCTLAQHHHRDGLELTIPTDRSVAERQMVWSWLYQLTGQLQRGGWSGADYTNWQVSHRETTAKAAQTLSTRCSAMSAWSLHAILNYGDCEGPRRPPHVLACGLTGVSCVHNNLFTRGPLLLKHVNKTKIN